MTIIGLIVVTAHNNQHRSVRTSKLLNRDDKARKEERESVLEKKTMTLLLEGLVKSVERVDERHGDGPFLKDTLGETLEALKRLTSRNDIKKIDHDPASGKSDPGDDTDLRVTSHGSSIQDLLVGHDRLEKADLRTKGMLSSV